MPASNGRIRIQACFQQALQFGSDFVDTEGCHRFNQAATAARARAR